MRDVATIGKSNIFKIWKDTYIHIPIKLIAIQRFKLL